MLVNLFYICVCGVYQITKLITILIKSGTFTNQSLPSHYAHKQEQLKQRPNREDENLPLHLLDLQKVSESVLTAAKEEMDQVFEKNIISSNDPNYEYDKRVEFNTEEAEPSDWDD